MEQLEIIAVRTSGNCEREARKYMKEFCRIAQEDNLLKAKFYAHASIPGDFALVIKSQTQEDKITGTDLGTYIAEVLKQFGLVDYNCWLMFENKIMTLPSPK